MKKILIIYPHFPPSNLAGVHRPRLFAQHLPSFGWLPIILTIDEAYYEERPDTDLVKLLPADLRVEKAKAFPITRPRLIGDIGLRGFIQLYKKARRLMSREHFDFLYIPVPSFYCALLGRLLNRSTGIKYGIDYIDPWVHEFPGSNKIFSRHWWSTRLARWLEPVALKKASLITGVAPGYYEPVLERNPHLITQAYHGAMPYGGEKKDHDFAKGLQPYLFGRKENFIQLVYAGAMLPKAYAVLEAIFKAIAQHPDLFCNVIFRFIGTGSKSNDAESYTIKPLAEKYGIWTKNIFEYPQRIPYLDVLAHLVIADGIFILGSTEPHYTPSKTYQGVLSGKPLLAVLHQQSSAVEVIRNASAGCVLSFNGESEIQKVAVEFATTFKDWLGFANTFQSEHIDMDLFEQYSALNITGELAGLLNKTLSDNG